MSAREDASRPGLASAAASRAVLFFAFWLAISGWKAADLPVGLAAVAGATWVSVHHGGGVGIGYSQHAGMVVVADGSDEAERRLARVLTTDPGMGVLRHVDAGYPEAIAFSRTVGPRAPHLGQDG